MDLPLFEGIISDLFPGRKRPVLDYGALNSVMKLVIQAKGLQPHPFFTTKVIIIIIINKSNIVVCGSCSEMSCTDVAVDGSQANTRAHKMFNSHAKSSPALFRGSHQPLNCRIRLFSFMK